jgi:protein-L-isoaspartate(D-aspartate) O-methyltransferase
MVIPVGSSPDEQKLIRVRHEQPAQFSQEVLGEVRFVPLVGEEAW